MTIYIRPDGTISGSNEPLPEKPDQSERGQLYCYSYSPNYPCDKAVCQCHDYDQALTTWKESCIDFEDRDKAWRLLPDDCFEFTMNKRNEPVSNPKPDTIIENVDVETEVVDQLKTVLGSWVDCYGGRKPEIEEINPVLQYRTAIRIKDKP